MPFVVKTRSVLFVVMVLALWVCTPRFGPVAAISIAVLVTFADRALIALHFAPVIGLTRARMTAFRDTGKLAIAAAVAGVATAVFRQTMLGNPPVISLLACGTFFVAVYAAVVVSLRIPNEDEWRLVLRYAPMLKPLLAGRA
jgi:hypothetical protein